MEQKQTKTFEQLGLKFSEGSDCATCRDMSSHNNVPSTFFLRRVSRLGDSVGWLEVQTKRKVPKRRLCEDKKAFHSFFSTTSTGLRVLI